MSENVEIAFNVFEEWMEVLARVSAGIKFGGSRLGRPASTALQLQQVREAMYRAFRDASDGADRPVGKRIAPWGTSE